MGRGQRTRTPATAPMRRAPDLRAGSANTPGWLDATVTAPNGLADLAPDARRVRADGFHPDTIHRHLAAPGRTLTRPDPADPYVRVELDNGWAVGFGWRQAAESGGMGHHASGRADGGAMTVEAVVFDDKDRMLAVGYNGDPLACQTLTQIKGLLNAAQTGRVVEVVVDWDNPERSTSPVDYGQFA